MAKKKHRRTHEIIAKKRQLQQIEHGLNAVTIATIAEAPVAAPLPMAEPNSDQTIGTHVPELIRTLLSIAVIAVLLVAALVIDHKTPYLTDFGSWLYTALRLKA